MTAESRLTRLAKVIIFVVFFAVGVAGFFLGNPMQKLHATEDEMCRASCTNARKLHRLVPVVKEKPDGPWSCECY